MVLKKNIIPLLVGLILVWCMVNNIYAQSKDDSFDKSIDYFQKLEQTKDSAQYAHELYAIAKYCRNLGMYAESRIAGIYAHKILDRMLINKAPTCKENYALYEEQLDMEFFLLDLLIGRGNQYLELSLQATVIKASTAVIAGYTICDSLRNGASPEVINGLLKQLEYPRIKYLNILTRNYWEIGELNQLIEDIKKAQQQDAWNSLSRQDQLDLLRRQRNAFLLPYMSLSTLEEYVDIAQSMYYPISVKDILYEQKLPEYFSIYRELARTCEQHYKPLYALKIYKLIQRLILRATENDYSFLVSAEQHELCEILMPYFAEMQNFAYKNRNLEGMTPFLYSNNLLMKELFVKPSFQYHRHLSEADSAFIINTQACIDSITFDKNSFKLLSMQDRVKWLQNQVLRREKEKTLIGYVKGKKSSPSLTIRQWNEIAASLDPSEAVIEIFSLPYEIVKDIYVAIILTRNKPPYLITLTEKMLSMKSEIQYNQIWLPIKEAIGDCTRLYVSSEEMVSAFSLAAIHNGNKYTIDECDIHYIFSSNDIPRIKSEQMHLFPTPSKKDIFFFGGADFNYGFSSQANRQGFQFLQGTVNEIRSIEDILSNQWNVYKYIGENATEEAFRRLSNRSLHSAVIHVATHSFRLLYNPKIKTETLQLGGYTMQENPLLRTGLVFSGVNAGWNGLCQMEINDGLTTALEIASMNLSETELIVLSGCDISNGDSRYGEGIFSLTRAFWQAGAKSLIITTKKISDEEPKELMTEFYKRWQNGVSKQKAFIQAQRDIKNQYPNESNKWAPYILIEM